MTRYSFEQSELSYHAEQYAADAHKLVQKEKFKKQQTGNLIGNWFSDKITKASRTLRQNSLKAVESKTKNTGFNKKLPEERYISPEEKQNLLMIWKVYNNIIIEYQKIINLLDNTPNQAFEFRQKIGRNKWWLAWNI